MKNFHAAKITHPFFEGWYLKHQKGKQSAAFIPGMHCLGDGRKKAFIQVITPDASYVIDYPYDQFYAAKRDFYIRVGNSSFHKEGVLLDIRSEQLTCTGSIRYSELTPIAYDIMGPFSLVPGMECSHGVLSLHHTLAGSIRINGSIMDFDGGTGYIEKDWGRSFPKSYTWLQCNEFPQCTARNKRAIMVSIARIPFRSLEFEGLIAIVYDRGREYRFATYNGGRIVSHSENEIVLRRGKYLLKAAFDNAVGNPLQAPAQGEMSRIVMERVSCNAQFEFLHGGRRIFCAQSSYASCETVMP